MMTPSLPQMIDLVENWKFKQANAKAWSAAEVPGCVHSDLYRLGKIPDPFYGRNERDLLWIEGEDWIYLNDLKVSSELMQEEHIDLVCEGLDTITALRLNGQEIARTDNMFVGYRLPVKSLLKKGKNQLEIHFYNPDDAINKRQPERVPMTCDYRGGRTQLRKQQCSFGWDWGPRLATSGIWRPMYLEGWSGNRIQDVRIHQEWQGKSCELQVSLTGEKKGKAFSSRVTLSLNGEVVATREAALKDVACLQVKKPALWWPNGHGDQPLYEVTVELLDGERVLDNVTHRIGLCKIELDQHADKWGTSFQFVINGKALFAKGANWIPAHSFVNEGEALIPDLLDSAVDANMNMLRVWGGGIYESDSFYEGCLERGLLVWQDFMFGCSIYPGDPAFVKQVKAEVEYQIRRLRNYSHIALWCGNNENEQMFKQDFCKSKKLRADYERIFVNLIPKCLEKGLPGARYISSSEHNPDDRYGDTRNPESGDAHYWGVWHSRAPITDYEKQYHRFFSEFGMQAYPHVETARTFTDSQNLFGPEMDNHQKNGGGNQIIFHYISALFRFPKDYEATVYLSQIMQAHCLRFGIEHMRRNMPRTMGALYWQINDCWPVASWSSIDFGGRWKALHYSAKRFFAPALVSVKVIGGEEIHRSTNTLLSSVSGFEIHTVFDAPSPAKGRLGWELWSVAQNKVLESGQQDLSLRYGKAVCRKKLLPAAAIEAQGRADLVLRTRLEAEGVEPSVNTTFMTTPRGVEFQDAKVSAHVQEGVEAGTFEIELTSDVIAYQIYLNLSEGLEHRVSDNFFDLFPGEVKQVILRPKQEMSLDEVRKHLTVYTYKDSYLD